MGTNAQTQHCWDQDVLDDCSPEDQVWAGVFGLLSCTWHFLPFLIPYSYDTYFPLLFKTSPRHSNTRQRQVKRCVLQPVYEATTIRIPTTDCQLLVIISIPVPNVIGVLTHCVYIVGQPLNQTLSTQNPIPEFQLLPQMMVYLRQLGDESRDIRSHGWKNETLWHNNESKDDRRI